MLVCGAGPTGLGAAWRLHEIGNSVDWTLVDALPGPGGMARSESCDGYVWDIGGHVLFPHYRYFDDLLDELIDEWEFVTPVRGAWMWGRFVPYPVQGNIGRLPSPIRQRILDELAAQPATADLESFECFLRSQFGDCLYTEFFEPLNLKMWGAHPSKMDWGWADHRSGSALANVPRLDVAKIRRDIDAGRDAPAWDDDTVIRYPAQGGTGRIWEELCARLPEERLRFGSTVIQIHGTERWVELSSGEVVLYEHAISSIPLDQLLRLVADRPQLGLLADRLRPAAVDIVGVGLRGRPPEELAEVCSLYVPDADIPFWRVTVLSNYSAATVPSADPHWSLLCEVNSGVDRPPPSGSASDAVLDGLIALGFIRRAEVERTWESSITHGYPVPLLGVESLLDEVDAELESCGITSRGRFGGWRYQVSNQDHAFMQGLEAVDRVVLGIDEVTYPLAPEIQYEDARRWNGREQATP